MGPEAIGASSKIPALRDPLWGAPEQLFEGSYFFVDGPPMFDVAPDGRFLMLTAITGNPQPQALKTIIVVQNWYEELKRHVPIN